MSELQLGLLVVGAAVVAGVFCYNRWQEARYRRDVQAGFGSRQADVLMGLEGGSRPSGRDPGVDRSDPALGSLDGETGDAEFQGDLSEDLDFIVAIETPEEVSGAAAAGVAAAVPERFPKQVRWEGFDQEHQRWEPLATDRRYSSLRAGMQLVDRRGAADEGELAAFGAAIEEAAASIDLLAPAPDAVAAASKARELDRFCSEADIKVAVHIQSDAAPFSGSRLTRLAGSLGFELDLSQGKFLSRDEKGRVQFAIVDLGAAPLDGKRLNALALQSVTLEMDVPHTPRGALDLFRKLAQSLAQGLGSRLVDDNRQVLDAEAFDAIEAQVQSVHSNMEARGIVPGGALALRLFS